MLPCKPCWKFAEGKKKQFCDELNESTFQTNTAHSVFFPVAVSNLLSISLSSNFLKKLSPLSCSPSLPLSLLVLQSTVGHGFTLQMLHTTEVWNSWTETCGPISLIFKKALRQNWISSDILIAYWVDRNLIPRQIELLASSQILPAFFFNLQHLKSVKFDHRSPWCNLVHLKGCSYKKNANGWFVTQSVDFQSKIMSRIDSLKSQCLCKNIDYIYIHLTLL